MPDNAFVIFACARSNGVVVVTAGINVDLRTESYILLYRSPGSTTSRATRRYGIMRSAFQESPGASCMRDSRTVETTVATTHVDVAPLQREIAEGGCLWAPWDTDAFASHPVARWSSG